MELSEIKRIIEAVLFVSTKPLTFTILASFMTRQTPQDQRQGLHEKIRQALLNIEEELRAGGHGMILARVGGGYQLRTDPALAPWLQRFLAARPERLSKSALETLSIIAYKQPLTRAEVEHIRGVDCSAVLAKLVEKNLIRIAGKKEVPGRPLLYGTTREFLELFGLNEISDLPTLRQLDELLPKEEVAGETDAAEPPPGNTSEGSPADEASSPQLN